MGGDVFKTRQIKIQIVFVFFFHTLSDRIRIGLTYQMIKLDFKLNKSNKTSLPTREDRKSES
jgi:hypothetical protein